MWHIVCFSVVYLHHPLLLKMCNTCLLQLGPRLLLLDDRLSARLRGGAAPASPSLPRGAPFALFVHGHRGGVGRWHEDGGETERGVGGKGGSLVQVSLSSPWSSGYDPPKAASAASASFCDYLSIGDRGRDTYVRSLSCESICQSRLGIPHFSETVTPRSSSSAPPSRSVRPCEKCYNVMWEGEKERRNENVRRAKSERATSPARSTAAELSSSTSSLPSSETASPHSSPPLRCAAPGAAADQVGQSE